MRERLIVSVLALIVSVAVNSLQIGTGTSTLFAVRDVIRDLLEPLKRVLFFLFFLFFDIQLELFQKKRALSLLRCKERGCIAFLLDRVRNV